MKALKVRSALKKFFLFYTSFFVISFIILAFIWSNFINGTLFVCSDPFPVLDFHPTFVHTALARDYFIASASTVYSVWYVFLALIFFVPATIASIRIKNKRVLILSILIFIVVLFGIAIEYFSHMTSEPPSPLPSLTDSKNTYYIIKLGKNYAVIIQNPQKEEYVIYVGNSKVNLDTLAPVKIIGDNPRNEIGLLRDTNTQCVEGKCHQIFNEPNASTQVVDIEKLEFVKY